MPIEIEAKMRVTDLAAVRDRLQAAAATPRGSVVEINAFFDTADRTLLAADKGLRVRTAHNRQTGTSENTITFKGPRHAGQLKSRDETEVTVGEFKHAVALMEILGYTRILDFEKRRESWLLDGCKVELDELPHLGSYVEIEGPAEAAVMAVRAKLQLNDRPLVRASYIALLTAYMQEHNAAQRVVRFPG